MSSTPETQPNLAVKNFTYCRVNLGRSGASDQEPIASVQLESNSPPPMLTAEDARTREERARQEGIGFGEERARASHDEALERERQKISNAIQQFKSEQAKYFRSVESEVVQLALSIAAKVLHREAQVDPLILAGVVRVALDKLREGTRISLRVHPSQTAAWEQYLRRALDGTKQPEVIGDNAVDKDCCSLQTSLGATDVSLQGQLKEIEHGLLDLLAQKPRIDS